MRNAIATGCLLALGCGGGQETVKLPDLFKPAPLTHKVDPRILDSIKDVVQRCANLIKGKTVFPSARDGYFTARKDVEHLGSIMNNRGVATEFDTCSCLTSGGNTNCAYTSYDTETNSSTIFGSESIDSDRQRFFVWSCEGDWPSSCETTLSSVVEIGYDLDGKPHCADEQFPSVNLLHQAPGILGNYPNETIVYDNPNQIPIDECVELQGTITDAIQDLIKAATTAADNHPSE